MKCEAGIFSFGYWGWGNRVPELRRRFLKFNKNSRGRGIVWVDIRVRRSARAEGFRGNNPERLLGKHSYEWLPEFGNQNILSNTAGIKIKDYAEGYRRLRDIVERAGRNKNDLILFCACKRGSGCHRNCVMRWLKKHKFSATEVRGEFPADIRP